MPATAKHTCGLFFKYDCCQKPTLFWSFKNSQNCHKMKLFKCILHIATPLQRTKLKIDFKDRENSKE